MRKTYADVDLLTYRVKATASLLGIADATLRSYLTTAGIEIARSREVTPGLPTSRLFSPANVFEFANFRREQGYVKTPDPSLPPTVITVDVMKGGTGKTTTSAELAVHLQLMGLRCVLVDLDVQANGTQMLGYEPDLTSAEAGDFGVDEEAIVQETLASVLIPYLNRLRGVPDRAPPAQNVVKKPFGEFGPHLIPSDIYLSEIEQHLYAAKGNRDLSLKNFIEASCNGEVPGLDLGGYDVVIFDCPPSVSCTSTCALAAADLVVAPIRMDAFSLKGLHKLMEEVMSLRKTAFVNPELVILPTNYSNYISRVSRMQTELSRFKEFIAPKPISTSEEFPKSLDAYLPLSLQKPSHSATKEYREFAQYIHEKVLKKAEKKMALRSAA